MITNIYFLYTYLLKYINIHLKIKIRCMIPSFIVFVSMQVRCRHRSGVTGAGNSFGALKSIEKSFDNNIVGL